MKHKLVLFFLGMSFVASATKYYVKNDGDDSKSGLSDSEAWATLDKVLEQTFSGGDTIFLRRGDSWVFLNEGFHLRAQHSGSPNNNVVFTSYGEGDLPHLTGYKHYTGWQEYAPNIYFVNRIYPATGGFLLFDGEWQLGRKTSVDSLDSDHEYYDYYTAHVWGKETDSLFVYCSDPNDTTNIVGAGVQHVVVLEGASNITLNEMRVSHGGNMGVNFTSGCSNITISNCIFELVAGNGLYVGSTTNYTIHDCVIQDVGNDGMYLTYSDKGDVYNNLLQRCGDKEFVIGDRQSTGIWYASNIDYHHNTIIHSGYGTIIEASNYGGSAAQVNVNFYNNKITATMGVKAVFTLFAGDFDIYNNLIVINSVDPYTDNLIGLGSGLDNDYSRLRFYHNTVVGNHTGIIIRGDDSTGTSYYEIKNNIFYDIGRGNIWPSPHFLEFIDSDYNLFSHDWHQAFGGEGWYDFEAWRIATGGDANSIIADPLFVAAAAGDYTLSMESPAIDAGTPVGTNFDFYGNPRDKSPDIGAFEYLSDEAEFFYLYPNPNNGIFFIVFAADIQSDQVNVVVTNILGQILSSKMYELEELKSKELDFSSIAHGSYVLTITDDEEMLYSKIFIMN